MCCVISTGACAKNERRIQRDVFERLRTAGRRADQQNARRYGRHRPNVNAAGGEDGAVQRPKTAQPVVARAELANFFDQFAAEQLDAAHARGLRDVVGGAERERTQADIGVPPGDGGGHDHRRDRAGAAASAATRRCRRDPASRRRAPQRPARWPANRATPRCRCARLATTSRSGSAEIQRENRPRTTVASSTIMTRRRARTAPAEWRCDGDVHRMRRGQIRPTS